MVGSNEKSGAGQKMKKTIIIFVASLLLLFTASPLLALDAIDINQAIRDKGANWVAGETSMSKLSPEEKRRLFMPATFNMPVPKTQTKASRYFAAGSLPAKFDWRNVNGRSYVTGVREQKKCSACWAIASTAALESRILITSHTPDQDLNLSEQALVSCDLDNFGCQGGYLARALSYLQTTGIPLETAAPYTSGETGIDGACTPAMQQNTYRVTSFEHIAASVESIKSALIQYGPLFTQYVIYEDFMFYESGVYRHLEGYIEGIHAVTIVGYDDAEQSWIVKNTWGPDWGESGYFRIRAGTNECEIEQDVYAIHFAVVPGASFVLSPASADFGTLVLPDQPYQTLPFTITNNGSLPLTNTYYAVTNPQFSVIPLNVSTIESAASADIQVTYTARAGKRPDTGELQVFSAGVTRESSLLARTNTRPDQPANRWPSDGAAIPLTVKLVASAFTDDDGDRHEASQWIIQNSSGDSVYSGSFDTDNKTSFRVPSGILQVGTQYYWQVIYRDDRGVESLASALTSFTIASQPQPDAGNSGCFIATAAFGSPLEKHVVILRNFRDTYLINNAPGRILVNLYYRYSPPAARFIQDNEFLRLFVRFGLFPFIVFCYAVLHYGLAAMCGVGIIISGIILTGALFLRRRSKRKGAFFIL
jgi:C1A family cysteine protease